MNAHFPDGKVRPDDEGAMLIAVKAERGTVIVTFQTAPKWIGLAPEDARTIARALWHHASQAEEQRAAGQRPQGH